MPCHRLSKDHNTQTNQAGWLYIQKALGAIGPNVTNGNKVVVSEPWYPFSPAKLRAGFSPWLYTDTLVAIQLVNWSAYRSDFPSGTTPGARIGPSTRSSSLA